MKRRSFLKNAALSGAALAAPAAAATPNSPSPMKITRVRFYHNPATRPMINQSFHIVTVETDAGITGIGEGGSKDLIEQCAPMIIGEDPSRIEHLWQMMFRGYFYPPGREKVHALGAIDLALCGDRRVETRLHSGCSSREEARGARPPTQCDVSPRFR